MRLSDLVFVGLLAGLTAAFLSTLPRWLFRNAITGLLEELRSDLRQTIARGDLPRVDPVLTFESTIDHIISAAPGLTLLRVITKPGNRLTGPPACMADLDGSDAERLQVFGRRLGRILACYLLTGTWSGLFVTVLAVVPLATAGFFLRRNLVQEALTSLADRAFEYLHVSRWDRTSAAARIPDRTGTSDVGAESPERELPCPAAHPEIDFDASSGRPRTETA